MRFERNVSMPEFELIGGKWQQARIINYYLSKSGTHDLPACDTCPIARREIPGATCNTLYGGWRNIWNLFPDSKTATLYMAPNKENAYAGQEEIDLGQIPCMPATK